LAHTGKARALNAALVSVDTDLVATVDVGTFLDAGAARAMKAAFADDQSLAAATGVLTPACSGTLSGRFYQWFRHTNISATSWRDMRGRVGYRKRTPRNGGREGIDDSQPAHRNDNHGREADMTTRR
jgi:cellulose synthase/poly-beta-1,6-N-acetylglucosamine synthase-like glycosyltransferase